MTEYVYVMKGLNKSYPGGKQVLKDTWLSFLPGAKIGIIGINGSGKSTLMKIIAGIDKDFTGEAWAGKNVTVGYLPQEPNLDPNKSVFENIQDGFKETKGLLDDFNALSLKFSEPMSEEEMQELLDQQAKLQEKIDAVNGWELDRFVEQAMDALQCPDKNANVTTLSGGERRRVALCKLLLEKPDILLLDEPTNHLDATSVAWLERHLQDYQGTVILVTHDRYFLDNVVGWILEIDRGQCFPFEGNYSAWLEAKQKRIATESSQEKSRQKSLKEELEWMRQSPKGRQAKSKARIKNYEELFSHVSEKDSATQSITIPPGPRLGDNVIKVSGLKKVFGDRILMDDLSFDIPPGAIVGVIGANGMGKSTLCKMITGHEDATKGEVSIGKTVQLSYVDQSRDTLNANKTVWEEISDKQDMISLGKKEVSSRAYCSWFNFKGTDQQKRVEQLSGGERNRVHLAKILKSGANVLILDEPTNDLDVETLRALEEALLNFAGTAIVISHDRFFLDRIATHILAFEGEAAVEWVEGNFETYAQDFYRRKNIDPNNPPKVKYKKLVG